jgi:hypothetical protein
LFCETVWGANKLCEAHKPIIVPTFALSQQAAGEERTWAPKTMMSFSKEYVANKKIRIRTNRILWKQILFEMRLREMYANRIPNSYFQISRAIGVCSYV